MIGFSRWSFANVPMQNNLNFGNKSDFCSASAQPLDRGRGHDLSRRQLPHFCFSPPKTTNLNDRISHLCFKTVLLKDHCRRFKSVVQPGLLTRGLKRLKTKIVEGTLAHPFCSNHPTGKISQQVLCKSYNLSHPE